MWTMSWSAVWRTGIELNSTERRSYSTRRVSNCHRTAACVNWVFWVRMKLFTMTMTCSPSERGVQSDDNQLSSCTRLASILIHNQNRTTRSRHESQSLRVIGHRVTQLSRGMPSPLHRPYDQRPYVGWIRRKQQLFAANNHCGLHCGANTEVRIQIFSSFADEWTVRECNQWNYKSTFPPPVHNYQSMQPEKSRLRDRSFAFVTFHIKYWTT